MHLADESSAEAQLIATQAAIAGILEAHVKVFETEFDEAWGTNPVCDQCRRMYPCDLRIALTDVLQDALHAREQKATAAVFVEASKIVARLSRWRSVECWMHCPTSCMPDRLTWSKFILRAVAGEQQKLQFAV